MPGWFPVLPVVIGAALLSLAVLVAVRNRTFFSPRLSVHFRLPVEFRRKRPGWTRKNPVALIVLNKPKALAQINLPIHIENISRRKLSDVSLELIYPRVFFKPNREYNKNFDDLLENFPEKEEEVEALRSILSRRTAKAAGGLVFVTYDVGTLRPGQSEVFYESITLPSRDLCFFDERFADTLFGKILQRLEAVQDLRGICHVRGRLLSDLNTPKYAWVNLVSARGEPLTEAAEKTLTKHLITPYAEAHWLGEFPQGRYFGPRLPFPKAYRQPFSRQMTVDLIYPKLVPEARKLKDSFIAAVWFDGMGSSFGYGYAELPGYDYFGLPRGLTRDQALMSIGYGHL